MCGVADYPAYRGEEEEEVQVFGWKVAVEVPGPAVLWLEDGVVGLGGHFLDVCVLFVLNIVGI